MKEVISELRFEKRHREYRGKKVEICQLIAATLSISMLLLYIMCLGIQFNQNLI